MTKLTRKKAIRMKCIDCSGGSLLEVKKCPIKSCTLYTFRLGAEEKVKVDDHK